MDAIEQQASQADIFKTCGRIFVHCCDLTNLFSFSVPSLPFLRLNGLFAHFSLYNQPSERRMCILPLSETLLQKLDGFNSPVVVDVKSSVIFEFDPEESEEESMLLIWDHDVVLPNTSTAQQPQVPEKDTLPAAPLLDITKLTSPCNCQTYPETSGVICRSNESDSEEENDVPENLPGAPDQDDLSDSNADTNSWYSGSEDGDDDDSVEHTLAFKCLGAAHEKPRQDALKVAARKMKEKLPVKARLRPEPENEKDNKAIAIDIDHGTGWFHAGYIASELTQYLHPLIENNKIVDTSVEHIWNQVRFARTGFYPLIKITRKGTWERFVIVRCQSAR